MLRSTDDASTGLGTYSAYIDGDNVKLIGSPDQTHVGIGTTAVVNTFKYQWQQLGS